MGSVSHEGSLLTVLSHPCSRDVEGKSQASGPCLNLWLDGVLQAFIWTCVQLLPTLASCPAVKRQLPIFADTGWIWRLLLFQPVNGSALLARTSLHQLLTGKNSFCGMGQRKQLP